MDRGPTLEKVPTHDELFNPTLEALRTLGGSGSNQEIAEQVVELLKLPPDVVAESHLGSLTQTELEYRLAWARTYLKKVGLLMNSQRGVWSLTQAGRDTPSVDPQDVVRKVRDLDKSKATASSETEDSSPDSADAVRSEKWRDDLLTTIQNMPPDAFERLCQLLLREAGFVEVEVTGRSGDGGIDGQGIIRLAGMLSFPIIFQCKRYVGSVGAGAVRDFRGAMVGRADRGLILTTGRFTKDAHEEATRDGAPPIDLVDGSILVGKLEELELGVRKTQVTIVDHEWLRQI